MIVSIVILGVLSAGTFVSLQHLYLRSAKSKAISDLSLESQIIVDQISSLMYDRVPISTIGYNPANNTFQSIYTVDANFTVLEWLGVASEAQKIGAYSGFVDMNASDGVTKRVSSLGSSSLALNDFMVAKFGLGTLSDMGLIFTGSFDDGAIYDDFNNAFGWHDNNASKIIAFTIPTDGNLTLGSKPNEIYEKYYFIDSAYALARGENIKQDATCINALGPINDINNTLFLFYNYRPWKDKGNTFCADFSGKQEGNVTILSNTVSGFEAGVMNGSIYFNITMNKVIRGSENNVTISKQKAVY
jgi:hypothetical protein